MCNIFHNTLTVSLSTVIGHDGQLTLHTNSHASDTGAEWQEGRTMFGTKFKLLHSEITTSETVWDMTHILVYIQFFA
jgi:hypothetical protein